MKDEIPARVWTAALVMFFVAVISCLLVYKETQFRYYGAPIAQTVRNLEGTTLHPLGLIVSNDKILLYDADGRIYDLSGITLDDIKLEDLSAAARGAFRIYRKNGQLVIGRETFWM